MRGLPIHAIDSFPPPLHSDLRQCLFSDILSDQACLDIESSKRQHSSSQLLSATDQSEIFRMSFNEMLTLIRILSYRFQLEAADEVVVVIFSVGKLNLSMTPVWLQRSLGGI